MCNLLWLGDDARWCYNLERLQKDRDRLIVFHSEFMVMLDNYSKMSENKNLGLIQFKELLN